MRCPRLSDLPPPPEGRTGWPWTEETQPLPDSQPNGEPWPRISIVTPSYNQGQYIEETIRSILLQGYPDLEYIVMDGGSTDESVEVIKKYVPWLTHWESGPDGGQAAAINKGFERTSGRWLNWINSDDYLLPYALSAIATIGGAQSGVEIVSGSRQFFADRTIPLGTETHSRDRVLCCLVGEPWFPQDSTFFSNVVWSECGPLNAKLRYVFDTAFFAEVLQKQYAIIFTNHLVSCMRQHKFQKTIEASPLRRREVESLTQGHIRVPLLVRIAGALSRGPFDHSKMWLVGLCTWRSARRRAFWAWYSVESEGWVISQV